MDQGFFRSKQFLVAAFVAALILVGGATVLALSDVGGSYLRSERGCSAIALDGSPLAPDTASETSDGDKARDESFALDAPDLARLDACLAVGELLVEPSPDGSVHVDVRVRSDAAASTRETVVETRFARGEDGVRLAVWQSRVGYSTSVFGGSDSAETTVVVQVPDGARFEMRATTDVGDVRADGVMLGNATLSADVGDVHVTSVDLVGDLDARSDVGDVIVHLGSVQTGEVHAAADVGDVEVRLPKRADVGYDVSATSGVGEVDVRLGDTETYKENNDPPGEKVEARSRGYASKPTQVRVVADADVGSVVVAL